jgi:hypothetical protein
MAHGQTVSVSVAWDKGLIDIRGETWENVGKYVDTSGCFVNTKDDLSQA